MFPGDRRNALEGVRLRSGRIFQSGKRRRIVTRRGSCSATRGEDYVFAPHLDKGYCDKEEEYQPIFEEVEEEEAPDLDQFHGIHATSHT